MNLQGSFVLDAPQAEVWRALNDPAVLCLCVPGCESLEATGDGHFKMKMAVKVGPVAARFDGSIQLKDVEPPNAYTMSFDARAGVAGFGKGSAKVSLTTTESGACELAYAVNAEIGGRIAQVGQRLVDGVARSMAKDFFSRFEKQLIAARPAPAVPEQVVPAEIVKPTTSSRLWLGIALLVAACVVGFLAFR